MIRDHQLYTNLSKVANSTFGTTGPGGVQASKKVAQSIKFEVIDENTLKATYQAIVNFSSQSMYRDLQQKYRMEGMSMLKGALERFAEEYKELVSQPESEDQIPDPSGKMPEKVAKKTIKLSANDSTYQDSVEHVSYSIYKPVQTGFYRLSCLIDVK